MRIGQDLGEVEFSLHGRGANLVKRCKQAPRVEAVDARVDLLHPTLRRRRLDLFDDPLECPPAIPEDPAVPPGVIQLRRDHGRLCPGLPMGAQEGLGQRIRHQRHIPVDDQQVSLESLQRRLGLQDRVGGSYTPAATPEDYMTLGRQLGLALEALFPRGPAQVASPCSRGIISESAAIEVFAKVCYRMYPPAAPIWRSACLGRRSDVRGAIGLQESVGRCKCVF